MSAVNLQPIDLVAVDSAGCGSALSVSSCEVGRLVWVTEDWAVGRNAFVIFRRRFYLEDRITSLRLHLFAATRYRLRVNGVIVGHGPARNVPALAEFDTYELKPWLCTGENVVVVEVNVFGEGCFQAVETPGVFAAWCDPDASVDLSTPGEWRARVSDAWDSGAPSWSFAQGPVEIVDHRRLPFADFLPGCEDTGWSCPVEHPQAELWGPLRPRSIPPAEERLREFARVGFLAPVAQRPRVGFRVPGETGPGRRYVLATFVHSPRAQTVDFELFWGPVFLNGVELRPSTSDYTGCRLPYPAYLRAGWNLLCAAPEALCTGWAQLVGWPGDAGLELRSYPDFNDTAALRYTATLSARCLEPFMAGPPVGAAELECFGLNWIRVMPGELPAAPALLMGWDRHAPAPMPAAKVCLPLRLPAAEATLMLDFGGEFLGRPEIEIEARPGTVVDLAYGERLRPDGSLLLLTAHNVLPAERHVTARPRELVSAFHPRGGRYLQITVRGAAPAVLHRCALRSALQPLPPPGPCFACSDPVLTRAWEIGRDTLLAAREDAWLDCPLRERGSYIGDGLVQARAFAPLAASDRLTARCLRLWAASQKPDGQLVENYPSCHEDGLADYTLLFVHVLYAEWARTGNLALVRELFPVVRRIFAGSYWKVAESGLWDVTGARVFIDWAVPPEGKRGESGVLNAFRVQALRLAASLADELGELDGDAWRAEAARVVTCFQSLWDVDAGVYAGARIDGRLSPHGRLHTNLLALAYDLVPPEGRGGVMDYVRRQLAENHLCREGYIELYFYHFAAEALYRVGLVAEVESLFREAHAFMQKHGAWTLWECLHRGTLDNGSLCHAWSASFNWVAAERILGVRPLHQGRQDVLLIAPESETLDWAEGAVAHPQGLVRVAWRIEAGALRLEVEAPRGVEILVAPVGRLARLPRADLRG